MDHGHGLRRKAVTVVWGLGILLALFTPSSRAQQLALSEGEILQMLRSGESPKQIEALARDYGISFAITEGTSRELREAGATPELIETLRSLAPKPATPAAPTPPPPEPSKQPVLVIESTPGSAQVYVDDEPVGRTSAEGRLKLTQLAPAEHRVRVSHDGHRDYDQKLQIATGETIRLVVKLEPLAAVAPPRPTSSTATGAAGPQPAVPGQPEVTVAFLGLRVGQAEGGGLPGVPIVEVQPGSPAEQAGLQAGQKVLAVDGQTISSPTDIVKAVRAHHPGEKAEIVFDDGKSLSKAIVLLGSIAVPAAEAAPPSAPVAVPPPGLTRFEVAHNHSSAMSWCYGVIIVGEGKIIYRSSSGEHSFTFPLSQVREVRKNPMYLSAMKGFHIRMADGSNYNFAMLRDGQWVVPYDLFETIEKAKGTGSNPDPHLHEGSGIERRMKRK